MARIEYGFHDRTSAAGKLAGALGFTCRLAGAGVLAWLAYRHYRDCCKRRPLPADHRDKPRSYTPCQRIDSTIYRRPDPLLYSQKYLMAQGLAVTWDNPDIQLERGGAVVDSHELEPDTTYDVAVRVWNGSTEAPAVDLPVRLSYIDFGIGGQTIAVGETRVDLPVKGAPGHPATARVPWTTPSTPGHYCLYAALDWPDDANPDNNIGQENTDVKATASPATFEVPVRNAERTPVTLRLTADAYAIAAARPCPPGQPARTPELTPEEVDAHRRDALARHGRKAQALPPGWEVEIEPTELDLGPGEEALVHVEVNPPQGFLGRRPININALEGDRLFGGVTVYVETRE